MTTRSAAVRALSMGLLLIMGCAKKSGDEPTGTPTPPAEPDGPGPGPGADRPAMTAAECEGQGGTVVGDIGDGAIHKPDYMCESGKPPLGNVTAPEGGPTPIEGAVCCPAS